MPFITCAFEQMWFNSGFYFCSDERTVLCKFVIFLTFFSLSCISDTFDVCYFAPIANFFYKPCRYLTWRLVWLHSQLDSNSLLSTSHPFWNHVGLLARNRIDGPEKGFQNSNWLLWVSAVFAPPRLVAASHQLWSGLEQPEVEVSHAFIPVWHTYITSIWSE